MRLNPISFKGLLLKIRCKHPWGGRRSGLNSQHHHGAPRQRCQQTVRMAWHPLTLALVGWLRIAGEPPGPWALQRPLPKTLTGNIQIRTSEGRDIILGKVVGGAWNWFLISAEMVWKKKNKQNTKFFALIKSGMRAGNKGAGDSFLLSLNRDVILHSLTKTVLTRASPPCREHSDPNVHTWVLNTPGSDSQPWKMLATRTTDQPDSACTDAEKYRSWT